MKIVRYLDPDQQVHYGLQHPGEPLFRAEGPDLFHLRPTQQPAEVAQVLAPLDPPAILCIGLNYRRHAEETGFPIPEYPVVFAKLPTAVIGPGAPIRIPTTAGGERVDYEAELAVVIGRDCRDLGEADVRDVVLGYTCANDVSSRYWQAKEQGGGQWVRAKSFDTFCPLGPCIVTGEAVPDPGKLEIRTVLSGEVRQSSNTSDMIFPVARLVSFLSQNTTLRAGTVILTGTPEGVGMASTPRRWLREGDEVSVEIEGIGSLVNPVVR